MHTGWVFNFYRRGYYTVGARSKGTAFTPSMLSSMFQEPIDTKPPPWVEPWAMTHRQHKFRLFRYNVCIVLSKVHCTYS